MMTPMMAAKRLDELAGEIQTLERKIRQEWRFRHDLELKDNLARAKKEILRGLTYLENDSRAA